MIMTLETSVLFAISVPRWFERVGSFPKEFYSMRPKLHKHTRQSSGELLSSPEIHTTSRESSEAGKHMGFCFASAWCPRDYCQRGSRLWDMCTNSHNWACEGKRPPCKLAACHISRLPRGTEEKYNGPISRTRWEKSGDNAVALRRRSCLLNTHSSIMSHRRLRIPASSFLIGYKVAPLWA